MLGNAKFNKVQVLLIDFSVRGGVGNVSQISLAIVSIFLCGVCQGTCALWDYTFRNNHQC